MRGAGRVALVVGASSGVGKACAAYLKDQGYHVYGGSRRAKSGDPRLEGANGGFLQPVHMDVRDEQSVNEAVQALLASEGGIGLVIFCPGYALAGAIEDVTPDEALAALDTMVLGAHRVYRAVLPAMREERDGLIITVSSVAGFIALPYQSFYSTAKFALEAMTESLRMEVSRFGIRVSLIEPGDIRTEFTANRAWAKAAKSENSAYAVETEKAVSAMARSEQAARGPETVVAAIASVIRAKNPPLRVIVGGRYKAVFVLKRLLPDWVIDSIVLKMYS